MSTDATSARLEIVGLDALPADRWDRFVTEHPDGSVYQLSAWAEILRRAYRFESRYLALKDPGGGLRGVLPLVRGRGPVSGSRLNSLPVVRWAGPLADSADGEAALIRAACDLVDAGEAKRLHLSSPRPGYDSLHPGLSAKEAHPAWWLRLPRDDENIESHLRGGSKSLLRNVRRAAKEGVTVRPGRSVDDLRAFYRLYLRTMRKLRVLPRSFRQLRAAQLLLQPEGTFRLLLAELDGRVVAGGVFHYFGGVADLLYNASDDSYLHARPNHALYWEAVRLAVEEGFATVDFGSAVPGTSLAEFKRRWGAEPVAVWHYVYPASAPRGTGKRSTDLAGRLRASGSGVAGTIWEHLPLPITRLAGTVAYRYL